MTPLSPSPTPTLSASLPFRSRSVCVLGFIFVAQTPETPLFMLGNNHQNTNRGPQLHLHPALSCGITVKERYEQNSQKQEGSCPVMCVWLSVGCCKQAEQTWMWLTLPDWLSVLAPGYKHAFPVIYRCGVVSHKASGLRERERAKQQYLIQVWQIFCRKSIQTAPSNLSGPPGSSTVVNCNL